MRVLIFGCNRLTTSMVPDLAGDDAEITVLGGERDLHAVYVIEVPLELSLESEISEDINTGEEILARIEAIASEEKYKGLQARFLRARQAGPAVVLESEERFMDLLIVGVPYNRRFGSVTFGSTASYIFHNASCQVMFWREQAPSQISLPRD